jgi:hypothetical protein
MFIHCTDAFAIMTATRCGHTNMYNYFRIKPHSGTEYTVRDWREHHNPIVVLRNPLDRVVSAVSWVKHTQDTDALFVHHSLPYMNNMLVGCNFRIIDFYDLEEYIPRQGVQSYRTDSRAEHADVYVENPEYTRRELEREVELYHDFMANRERLSIVEWRELTR